MRIGIVTLFVLLKNLGGQTIKPVHLLFVTLNSIQRRVLIHQAFFFHRTAAGSETLNFYHFIKKGAQT
ncbi:MAG TPA: hypothetical protein DDY17_05610 [Syntrophaceae bacterium]|jgi:hypothetical protein|nr:hypothetical protein [Syntrophaceae bacterium]